MNLRSKIFNNKKKIPLNSFINKSLYDLKYGFYMKKNPIGVKGDFITSPNISILFSEMIAIWCISFWKQMGSPKKINILEIGPGDGSLSLGLINTFSKFKKFNNSYTLNLLEKSKHLIKVQKKKLIFNKIKWISNISNLNDEPVIIIANEFFDALPIRQFQRLDDGWAERVVSGDENGLRMGLAPPVLLPREGQVGEVIEDRPAATAIVTAIASRVASHGGAAILVDYGGWNGVGDTFQALRAHRPEDPLAHPGEADLTAHVDFAPLAAASIQAGAVASRPIHQGDWLLSLGAADRARRLAAAGDRGAMVALDRLTAADKMGHLFKAMAIWPRGAPPVPGFDALRLHADNA